MADKERCEECGCEVTAFDIHVTDEVKLWTLQPSEKQGEYRKLCTDCCPWDDDEMAAEAMIS